MYAVTGHTAANVIVERVDWNKDFMGLTSFEGNLPSFYETIMAKNYLSKSSVILYD